MSDTDLTVSGSTHQADCHLSDVSRGRQCAFMSLSAMLLKRANSCHVSQWTADTVNEILIEGDAMYVKAFDDDTIPDIETLSLTYLPDRVNCPKMTADPAKSNQYLPRPLRVRNKMFIHVSFIVLAVVCNTVIVTSPMYFALFLTQSCTFSNVY